MKIIKILSVMLTLLIVVFLQACDNEQSHTMPVESSSEINSFTNTDFNSMEIIAEELELSDSQADEVKAVLKAHVQKVKNDLSDDFLSLTREEKKAFFADERSGLKEELKSALTEEQLNKLLEMREQLVIRIETLLGDLNLTDQQKDEIASMVKTRYESQTWRNLNAQERREYKKEFRQELAQLLTDEQKEILKDHIKVRYHYYANR